jgi:hypothetical protein
MVAYFILFFHITISWIHNFHVLYNKCSVIISKVYNKSIFFLNLIHNFWIEAKLIKIYYNVNDSKIDNVNVEYDFTF